MYAAAWTSISKIAGAIQRGEQAPVIEITSIGSPAGWGGTVTPEFVQAERERGLAVQGEVFADFIKSSVFKDGKPEKNTKYIFEGDSKGAEVARQTTKLLPELRTRVQQGDNGKTIAPNLQLLLDAPVNYTQADTLLGRINSKIKSLQIPVGFAIEGITEIATNKKLRKAVFAGEGFYDTLRQTAAEKGLVIDESDEMKKLKREAKDMDIAALRKPPQEEPSDIRAFTRKGTRDITTGSPIKWGQMKMRGFGDRVPVVQEGSEMVFGIHAGHAVPLARIQVDRFKDRAKTVLKKQFA